MQNSPPNREINHHTTCCLFFVQFHGCLYPGTLPALVETRTYDGDRLDFGGIISGEDRGGFEAPKESQLCERWAVLSSATSAYYGESNITAQLSSLDGWCVVIVGDTRQGEHRGPTKKAPRRRSFTPSCELLASPTGGCRETIILLAAHVCLFLSSLDPETSKTRAPPFYKKLGTFSL